MKLNTALGISFAAMLGASAFVSAWGYQSPDESARRAAALIAAQSTAEMGAAVNQVNATAEKPSPAVPVPGISSEIETVAADPSATALALNGFNALYLADKVSAKSAAQASQVATEQSVRLESLLVAQNARIITLLTKIAAKTPTK